LAAPEQFVVDLADLVEALLDLAVSGQTLARLLDLVRSLEQERLHLALGKAAVEVKERTMLGAGGVAVAVGFATFHKALDQGGVKEVSWLRPSKIESQMASIFTGQKLLPIPGP
jgi:hypothetical protein